MQGMFQFTRPRGRDINSKSACALTTVSIHAPTGARRHDTIVSRRGRRFNSRAHGGATSVRAAPVRRTVFQFTRPRGRDSSPPSPRCRTRRFNSRAHGGATPSFRFPFIRVLRFNSRAHGGATSGGARARPTTPSFNSRAHGGATRPSQRAASTKAVSIHAPTGARPVSGGR